MPQAPVRGEAQRLLSINDIAHDIRRQEGQPDHVLDAAPGGAGRLGNLIEGLAGADLFKPHLRPGDVADQGLVLTGRGIGEHEPRLDATLAQGEWMAGAQPVYINSVRVDLETRGEGGGVKLQVEGARRNVVPLNEGQE